MKTRFLQLAILVVITLISIRGRGQTCIQTSQYPTGTVNISGATGTTNISTCNYAGEFSVNNFSATGTYTILATGGSGNYITVTDVQNNPLISGNAPLSITIPSVGIYRIHLSTSSSCGTDATCHNVSVVKVLPPCIQTSQYPIGTVNISGVTGTNNISACTYAGEFSVNNFSATGTYTILATGGSGNYLTVTDNLNNHLISGNAPLSINIPSVGLYRIHVSTSSSCGTDGACHNISVTRVLTPCIQTTQYPPSTVGVLSNGTTTNSTCNYGGDYSVQNFTATGTYTFIGVGGAGNYFTITDNVNNVLTTGFSPLAVIIPSVGIYRMHFSINSGCAIDAVCHTVTVVGNIPDNDLCDNAIMMSVPSSTSGTTIDANMENPSPAPCGPTITRPGVWYKVIGNGNQFGASLCNTVWDSKLHVYAGTCGSLTCVAGVDDNGPMCSGTSASVMWCSVPTLTYYILVSGFNSNNNFTINFTETVTVQPNIVVTAGTTTICPSSSTTLTASGASSYTWNTGDTTASIQVSPTSSTTYTVIGSPASGCGVGQQTASVTVAPPFIVTASSSPSAICAGETATLVASAAAGYTWNGVASTDSLVISPTASSVYTLEAIDSFSCSSSTTAAIMVNPLPTVSIAGTNTFLCSGQTTTLTASGASSYSWTNLQTTNSIVVTPSVSIEYGVIGTDTYGCTDSTSIAIEVNTITLNATNNATICQGDMVTLTANAMASYTWLPGNINSNSVAVTPNTTTTYTINGTDSNNCEHATTLTVSVNLLPTLTSGPTPTICIYNSATLSVSGATSYSWDTSGSGSFIVLTPTVAAESHYIVTGTNAMGCKASLTLTLISDECVGITETTLNKNMNVYPNPSTGEFIIELQNGMEKTITVSDVTGRIVFTLSTTDDRISANLKDYANGIYYVKLNSGKTTETVKIVKQ